MRWLIDANLLIEGERGNPTFHPWLANPASLSSTAIPSLSVKSVKSVVPTAVFRFDSPEIAGFDQFCLASLSSLRKI